MGGTQILSLEWDVGQSSLKFDSMVHLESKGIKRSVESYCIKIVHGSSKVNIFQCKIQCILKDVTKVIETTICAK